MIYLAALEDDLELSDEIRRYLSRLHIEIQKEYPQLGLFKLKIPAAIELHRLRYFKYVEPEDPNFKPQ